MHENAARDQRATTLRPTDTRQQKKRKTPGFLDNTVSFEIQPVPLDHKKQTHT